MRMRRIGRMLEQQQNGNDLPQNGNDWLLKGND
jgi:hypothetical protein